MLELSSAHPNQPTDASQLIQLATAKGFTAHTWTYWYEYEQARASGHAVVAILDNALLRPTAYPNTPGWHAQHWIRLMDLVNDGDLIWCEDPLTYLPNQPSGPPYQGPSLYLTASVRAAIAASTVDYAGIIVERGDDIPQLLTPLAHQSLTNTQPPSEPGP